MIANQSPTLVNKSIKKKLVSVPKPFEVHESYKHLFAKNLLLKWLKEHELHNEGCNFCGLCWRKNQGIFSELKFYKTSTPFYFEHGVNAGQTLFIPDITIFHQGKAFIIIEIVHRSPVSAQKLGRIRNFYNGEHFELYEIEADHILNNTDTPSFLTYKLVA